MTRNEAITKISVYRLNINTDDFLAALEALGLIKFDEEMIESPSSIIADHIRGNIPQPLIKADKIICALMAAGYQIIRKEYLEALNKMVDEK